MCIKGPCPPRQVCKNFESVCEVPAGWIVEPIDTKLPNPNEKDFFIKSWQKSEFSNQEGLVWLSGGMGNSDKRSGLKTTGDPDRPSMAIVVFTAKKGGKAEVKVTEAALKNSLGDGQFVEKGSVVLTVTDVDRMPTDIPPSTPAPVSKIRHLFNQVFGSGGGPDNQ